MLSYTYIVSLDKTGCEPEDCAVWAETCCSVEYKYNSFVWTDTNISHFILGLNVRVMAWITEVFWYYLDIIDIISFNILNPSNQK
jgi:hypothetical protein